MPTPTSRSFCILTIVGLSLAGAWVSGTLLIEHDGGWATERQGTGFLLGLCESQVLPSVSCARVVDSRWGSFDLYLGSRRIYVPTSLIGLAYFTSLAIWFAMVGRLLVAARWMWVLTLLVVSCGLIGSVFFMVLMALTLSEWCPPCVIAHLLNGAIFLGTIWLWRSTRRASTDESTFGLTALFTPARVRRRLAGWAMVVSGATALGLWFYFDAATEVRRQWRKLHGFNQVIAEMQNDRGFVLREYFAQPVVEIPRRSDDNRVALACLSESAPRLLIFTDYDCSKCACFEFRRHSLIESAFCGNLEVDYRHFPRHRAESGTTRYAAADGSVTGGNSFRASLAAEAARLQGGDQAFATMHRLLFEHRKDRPDPGYAELARLAALDAERLLVDMSSDVVRRRVRDDVTLAARLGVTAAPAIFLDGRRVPDLCATSPVFWKAVAEKLTDESALTATPTEIASR
ncbi:MAG: thioredoxin domain-containing protein [Phycisphaerales bacterium]|nr:MAG: thioredoxin domain-containing protein [Phycisphaerales bacterium]